jgi:hypothetical protein
MSAADAAGVSWLAPTAGDVDDDAEAVGGCAVDASSALTVSLASDTALAAEASAEDVEFARDFEVPTTYLFKSSRSGNVTLSFSFCLDSVAMSKTNLQHHAGT